MHITIFVYGSFFLENPLLGNRLLGNWMRVIANIPSIDFPSSAVLLNDIVEIHAFCHEQIGSNI